MKESKISFLLILLLFVTSCGEEEETITYKDKGVPSMLLHETILDAARVNETVFELAKMDMESYRKSGSLTSAEYDSAMVFVNAVEEFEDYLVQLRRNVISRREGVEASLTDTMRTYRMVHLTDTSGMTLDEMMDLQTELRKLEPAQKNIPHILGERNKVSLDVDEYWFPEENAAVAWYYMNFPGRSLFGVILGLDAVKLKVTIFKCEIMRYLISDIKERGTNNQKMDSIH